MRVGQVRLQTNGYIRFSILLFSALTDWHWASMSSPEALGIVSEEHLPLCTHQTTYIGLLRQLQPQGKVRLCEQDWSLQGLEPKSLGAAEAGQPGKQGWLGGFG